MEEKYCNVCGKELVAQLIEPAVYDTYTGKRITRNICPSGSCMHFGIIHDMSFIKLERKFLFFKYLSKALKCERCGETFEIDDSAPECG